ncbi:MAG: methyltransferase [Robiginitomaculum sp.]|nr:MAG: methyltransferase [Robiginitomaculum sp.]
MRDIRFFDGQVQAFQPNTGYLAGTDTGLLAASLEAKAGARVLELGTGSGAALLMANHHLENCHFTGVDQNPDMLTLARKNTQDFENIEIVEGDVGALPKHWHLQFDQVFANPPYFDDGGKVRMSAAKAPSFVAGATKLPDWIASMLVTLKPRGTGALIYRADGLELILASLLGKAGRIRILPVQSFADEPAKRVIVQFRKGVKSESALLPALVLHTRDGDGKFTPEAAAILAGKCPLRL